MNKNCKFDDRSAVVFLVAAVAVLALCGCAGGMFGTGVLDGKVSDTEASIINAGGGMYGAGSAGTKAQGVLGSPAKAEARRYPLLGETTQYWDSVGTVVKPPITYRVDPDFGSITGTYGVVKAPAQATIDPALQAIIQQAVLNALQGQPARPATGGPSVPVTGNPATPAPAGDAGSPIAPAIRAVMQ